MPEYNKLVRDKIPEIITKAGETPITHVLSEIDYEHALIEKIGEEHKELEQADTTEQMEEELADILESAEALAEHISSLERVKEIQAKKKALRGGFVARIFLERTE